MLRMIMIHDYCIFDASHTIDDDSNDNNDTITLHTYVHKVRITSMCNN